MPQVVKTQPTGAFTQGGAGIGAVIFDKPQYDTQTVAMKVADDLDAFAKKKEQEVARKQQNYQKLISDLDFDTSGVLNNDRPKIKELSEITISTLADALKSNTPDSWASHQKAKADLENLTKASKMDADLLKIMSDPKKLEEIDNFEDLQTNAAYIRTLPIDSKERELARSRMTAMPTPKTSLELLTEKIGKIKGKEESSQVVKDHTTGGYVVEKTSEFLPDKQVESLAQELEYDSKYSKARTKEWEKAIGYNPETKEMANKDVFNSYVNKSQLPENAGKSPYRLFIEDQIRSFQNVSKTKGGIVFTPRQKEQMKFEYKNLGNSLPAAPYAESLAALFNKDKTLWKEVPSESVKGQKEYVSNLYYGTKIGGDAVKLDDGEPIAKTQNVIEQWKMDDNGNVFMMTTQSRYNNEMDNTKPKYIKVSNAGEILPSIIQAEFGEQADDIIGGFYKQINNQGASLGGTSYDHNYFYKTTKDDEGNFVKMRGYNRGYGEEKLPPVEKRQEKQEVKQPSQQTKKAEDLRAKYKY